MMQAAAPRHVLLVGAPDGGADRVAPLLQRADFDVHAVRPSDIVLDLVLGTGFDLLVVGYPAPEIDLVGLIRAVRLTGSASLRAGFVLLAKPGFLEAAQGLLSIGANRAVSLAWSDARLWCAIDDLVHVAPRGPLQAMLFADVDANGSRDHCLYRTVNVSRTGVLLQGERLFAPGTPFDFAFRLPFEARPIGGRGEVVRQSSLDREGMAGLGARFVALRDGDEARLQRFVQDGQGSPAHPRI